MVIKEGFFKGLPVCVLFSGGKDSTYALHWAFLKGFDVRCLVTLKPQSEGSWMFHYPAVEVTKLQSEALGIPQIYRETLGIKNRELKDLKEALETASAKYGIKGVVTGALLSDYQRMNISLITEELSLKVYSPLWRKGQDKYMLELVEYGFKFIITSISVYGLPPNLLGRILKEEDVVYIARMARRYGFNPAFEGGEAETLVVDAPLFRKALRIVGEPIQVGEYNWRYVVKRAWLEEK